MKFFDASAHALDTGQYFGAILLDYSKAYDRVNRSLLLIKLVDAGISPELIKAVYSWLNGREYRVTRKGDISDPRGATNGCPKAPRSQSFSG